MSRIPTRTTFCHALRDVALPAADIVHGCRFLDRPLLRAIAAGGVVRPGGLLIWSTFLEAPGGARAAPPYKASRCLRRGEMAELFAGPEWTTLCDAEGELTTRGVRTPAAFFVARRRRLQPR